MHKFPDDLAKQYHYCWRDDELFCQECLKFLRERKSAGSVAPAK